VKPSPPLDLLILTLRGQKVILDADLAALYGRETRVLNQAVKRNLERFPADFCFQLTRRELASFHLGSKNSQSTQNHKDPNLKSQIVTSSLKNVNHQYLSNQYGGRHTPPYAFTEHDALMAECP